MDIRPSEEQALLRDMVRRFLADRVPAAEIGRGPLPIEDWRALAELGVAAVTLPEASGGMAAAPQDSAIVAEELGRALAITPFAEGMLGAADLIARHAPPTSVERWAAPAGRGEVLLALAYGAVEERNGTLHGRCGFVRWGSEADAIVVLAGASAYVVASNATGLARTAARLADGTPAAMLTFDRCTAETFILPEGSAGAALALPQLGYVAEMVGAMALVYEQSVDYARQRRQFDVPIASFQVIQHKLARMFVQLEQAQSMLLKASLLDRGDPAFARNVTAAKAYVADAAQSVAENAVQIHGGMGVTDELAVGRALRRIIVLARLFGRADEARERLAA